MAKANTTVKTEEVINDIQPLEKKVSKTEVPNNTLNKDGFAAGQAIDNKAYVEFVAKQRLKK